MELALSYNYETLAIFNRIVLIFFLFDFIINVIDSLSPAYSGFPTPKEGFKNYFKYWFWVDLVSAVPVEFWFHRTGDYFLLIRVVRLMRLAKVAQFMRRWSKSEFAHQGTMRLIFFLFWTSLLTHWISCGWIILGGIDGSANLDKVTTYIRALYWAITTLTTIGYGDITPKTNIQMVFTMMVMIIGAGLYGYIIGNITNLLSNTDIARANFMEKMEKINTFLKYRKIPDHLQERIYQYYNFLWENRKGYDESTIMDELPSSLRMKVALYLNREIFEKIPLFKNATPEFISELVLSLKPSVFTPGDFIFKKGEMGHSMYFISRGSVEIYDPDLDTTYGTLNEGSFFGEISLLHSTPRTASVRALDYCDLYVLDRATFERVVLNYPSFAKQISEEVKSRTENIKRVKKNFKAQAKAKPKTA